MIYFILGGVGLKQAGGSVNRSPKGELSEAKTASQSYRDEVDGRAELALSVGRKSARKREVASLPVGRQGFDLNFFC